MLIAVAIALAGCAATNPYPAATYERALHDQERGHDREAVAAIEQFLRRSPTDTLAPRAQRLKVLSLLRLKEYPLAVVELQILRQEYPNSPFAGETWFLEGEALFKQVGRLERDIAPVYDARERFNRFLSDNPDDPRGAEARAYLVRISDLILNKKLGEAEVYAQLGQPAAAGVVLDAVLDEVRDGSLRPRVLLRRAQVALKAKQPADAARAWQRLVDEHSASPEAAEARRALAKLPGKGS